MRRLVRAKPTASGRVRQLTKWAIGFEPLDNGILRCAEPAAMQRLTDRLTVARVDALLRRWLAQLRHPFSTHHREQGIRYDISICKPNSRAPRSSTGRCPGGSSWRK